MDNKNIEKLILTLAVSVIFIPIGIVFYFLLRKKCNKKIERLKALYDEIENIYLDHKNDLQNFNLNVDLSSKDNLYKSYESLLITETSIKYVQDIKKEANDIISEIRSFIVFSNNPIMEKDWNKFNSNDIIENKIISNIENKKIQIYKEFKKHND